MKDKLQISCISQADFSETRAYLRTRLLGLVDPESTVLDAGCGRGNLFISRDDVGELVGIDIDAEAVAANRAISRGKVVDLQTHMLGECGFDAVMSCDVLEHIRNPATFLRNAVLSLKPGGFLFLITPNRSSFFGLLSRMLPLRLRHYLCKLNGTHYLNNVHFYRANTIGDLFRIVRDAGCVDIEIQVLNRLPSSRLMRPFFLPGYLLCRLPGFGRWGSGLLSIARKPGEKK
jgi:2-polyprenyl-3-methyl-5-hydroxy-6-metoxy-1,4-benzoquinol methylase